MGRAKVLSALSDLYDKMGDVKQAITQTRRALALNDTLPGLLDRPILHKNIAGFLLRSGDPALIAEADRHPLTSLIYNLSRSLERN